MISFLQRASFTLRTLAEDLSVYCSMMSVLENLLWPSRIAFRKLAWNHVRSYIMDVNRGMWIEMRVSRAVFRMPSIMYPLVRESQMEQK